MEIEQERLSWLEKLDLAANSHASIERGACAMEAASFVAGEEWSDHPKCVSPVIGAFMRSWNDSLDDKNRQRLKPYIAKILDTAASKEVEDRRAWIATDWIVREYLPAWLRQAKLENDAEQVSMLPEITAATILATMPTLKAVQKNSVAAWDAARAAARDAAWDA